MLVKVAGFEKCSVVDGPGLRYTVFFQGCSHGCEGCHNPQTHDFHEGKETTTEDILQNVLEIPGITGVTISGGDPFFQYDALLDLCTLLRNRTNLNIWVYTGYTENEVEAHFGKIWPLVDALVVGPYIQAERTLSLPFVGSKNQKIIYLKR